MTLMIRVIRLPSVDEQIILRVEAGVLIRKLESPIVFV